MDLEVLSTFPQEPTISLSRGGQVKRSARHRLHRGAGIEGIVDGTSVAAGSRALILKGSALPAWAQPADVRYLGQPVLHVFVTIEQRLAAVVTFGVEMTVGAASAVPMTANDAVAARQAVSVRRMLIPHCMKRGASHGRLTLR